MKSGTMDYIAIAALTLIFTLIPAAESVYSRVRQPRLPIHRVKYVSHQINNAIQMELDRSNLRCIRMVE